MRMGADAVDAFGLLAPLGATGTDCGGCRAYTGYRQWLWCPGSPCGGITPLPRAPLPPSPWIAWHVRTDRPGRSQTVTVRAPPHNHLQGCSIDTHQGRRAPGSARHRHHRLARHRGTAAANGHGRGRHPDGRAHQCPGAVGRGHGLSHVVLHRDRRARPDAGLDAHHGPPRRCQQPPAHPRRVAPGRVAGTGLVVVPDAHAAGPVAADALDRHRPRDRE